MCYSYQTSIIAYIVGLLSVIFALYTNQIILGLLILFYCQIQLSEAIIWKGIDDNNIELNKKGTIYGKYFLASHNIAIGLGILIMSKKYSIKSILPLLISILFFLFVVYFYYQNNENITHPDGRLQWGYPDDWYIYGYVLSLIFFIIYVNPLSSKIFLISIFSLTFLLSFFYNTKQRNSVWCFLAAILSPFIVIINYFLTRD